MISAPNSIFRSFVVPTKEQLHTSEFAERLQKLEKLLIADYNIKIIPNGWYCTPKNETELVKKPGFVITPDSVLYVMKNLEI